MLGIFQTVHWAAEMKAKCSFFFSCRLGVRISEKLSEKIPGITFITEEGRMRRCISENVEFIKSLMFLEFTLHLYNVCSPVFLEGSRLTVGLLPKLEKMELRLIK